MSLHALFSPKSIAVVGASTRAGSVGNDVAKNLVKSDFRGSVYLVNPKGGKLFGKDCYASLKDLPEPVELVIIIVPAKIVPQILREAGERMARAAVIISAGFRETGKEGQALEEEIIALAQEYRIELLGPNCLGFIRPRLFLNASFASTLPVDGSIAFFSQSGALTSAFLDLSYGKIGFSTFASIGNKATLNEAALLTHFQEDDATKVIGFYTESLENAPRLISLGKALAKKGKPVIALKSGTTEAGTQASSSHTGAVAGSDAAYSALFRQARMTRAKNFQELLDFLSVFSQNPLPTGKRVAIVTNAGGLGVLTTDACIENGLELAQLDPGTITELQKVLPAAANAHNPIDILGDALADRYEQALSIVARDPNIDLLIVILTPQTMTENKQTAEVLAKLKKQYPKLPLAAVFSGKKLTAQGEAVLAHANIPNFTSPERAAQSLGALAKAATWKQEVSTPPLPLFEDIQTTQVSTILHGAREKNILQLNEATTTELLKVYHFPFLESKFVTHRDEALAAARAIGKPVALKIVSPDIIHKSDVGGVLLDVNPDEADVAFEHLLETVKTHVPKAKIDGALLVEMAEPNGLELLLGLKQEPGLGTLVVVGLGGIYVEVFKDISMRFAPLTATDIDEMLTELKAYPLLTGARGKPSIDLNKLKEYIARLSQLAIEHPEIAELDINPLLVFPEGERFKILDARVRLRSLSAT